MKKFIIIFTILFSITFDANAWQDKPKKDSPLSKASKEASECNLKIKDSKNPNEKIDCLLKITAYLDLKARKLQQDLLDLQLATTGY